MTMIKKRDQDTFNMLDEFHIMTASQIFRLFFSDSSYRYCQFRLQRLFEQGFLKRARSTISNDYAYYTEKRNTIGQTHHDLIRAELYINLKQHYDILEWTNETKVNNIRPDAVTYINNTFTYIKDHGIIFPVFIEIHLNNKFNFDKYVKLLQENDLKAMYGIMPRVIVCTDRQLTVPNIGIKFKVIDLDMKGLDSIFK